jgi:hypothetical protein
MLAPEPTGAAFFPYQPFSRDAFPIVSSSFLPQPLLLPRFHLVYMSWWHSVVRF